MDGAVQHPKSSAEAQGVNGSLANGGQVDAPATQQQQNHDRMNDLPDAIPHITQGFVPVSLLLTRLAQVTHNSLQSKVQELGQIDVPASAAPDNTTKENLRKKTELLNFAQETHSKWVKALVITEWSRKADSVSKLIDLKAMIDQHRFTYDSGLDRLVNASRNLGMARMPSPDLKTALQVLSTGQAPYMPDLHYIEPPPLTTDEQIKWLGDINTLLALRLNLEDFDRIPSAFRDYSIDSGRATFKVAGEFEVDLTVADEDVDKQFWFIDFRFAYEPSATNMSPRLRGYLEHCVNEELAKDGLAGCYRFLHEFVMTCKITELKRQAQQLSRTMWSGSLVVEPLNRALAIQYWTARSSGDKPKNWVLVAVDSGEDNVDGEQKPSRLVAKWYRDNKEVVGAKVRFDDGDISADSLLRSVVGMHIEHVLSSIRDKLLAAGRYKDRKDDVVLHLSQSNPGDSRLTMKIGHKTEATLLVEPTSGFFSLKPHSRAFLHPEHQLNTSKSQAEDGVNSLETARCAYVEEQIHRTGGPMGWTARKSPISSEAMRSITKLRDWTRAIWLQREGWDERWNIVVFLSLGGDKWRLVEVPRTEATRTSKFQVQIPLGPKPPKLSEIFWKNLTIVSTAMMLQRVELAELYESQIRYKMSDEENPDLPMGVKLPSLEIALSAMFPEMVVHSSRQRSADADELAAENGPAVSTKRAWADNTVTLSLQKIDALLNEPAEAGQVRTTKHLIQTSVAIIKVHNKTRFARLAKLTDRDVSFWPEAGEFRLRLRLPVSEPMMPVLKARIKAVDRFVNFLEAMDGAKETVKCESVTLRAVECSYADSAPPKAEGPEGAARRWRMAFDLSNGPISISLDKGNPHVEFHPLMQHLVNIDGGIAILFGWLPASLPVMRALQDIRARQQQQQQQQPQQDGRKQQVSVRCKDLHSITLLYGPGGARFSLELKSRQGAQWWLIRRVDAAAVWPPPVGEADGWMSLGASAVARPGPGVAEMLEAADRIAQQDPEVAVVG